MRYSRRVEMNLFLAAIFSASLAFADTGADTGDIEDTGQVDDSGDADDSGDTSSSDSGSSDTGTTDSGSTDTATADSGTTSTDTGITSASKLSGETGGFGCATVGVGGVLAMWFSAFLIGLRRRD